MAKTHIVTEVDGRRVKLSNLSKVLFPEMGIVKAEVIEYYMSVAPFMLPFLRNRPLTLIRFPDGIAKERFYAKNKPSWTPDWIASTKLNTKDGNEYLLATEIATIVWLANLAALEIHPMQVRSPEFDLPDFFVFDLDPPNDQDFASVKGIAFALKDFLESYGYHPFVKTSGSKGLHLMVPVIANYSHEELIASVKALAKTFIKENPKSCTLKMSKQARKGKLLLDIFRNHKSMSTVAPFSLRAKPGAPVSMPIPWDLLDQIEESGHFKLREAMEFLEANGNELAAFDQFAVALHDHRDREVEAAGAEPADLGALRDYAKKRNFQSTAEPAAVVAKGSGNRFVIQLHDASNLHYDLRLEKDGVLLSWAIPKGFPLRSGTKRLAVETEPHPVKYLSFEGTIPKGEYGGGEMWVFDSGKFEWLDQEEKKLKFRLFGKKIKGVFSLYRVKEKQWLLDRKADGPTEWFEQHTPHMLADSSDKVPRGKKYEYEIKWDGIRAMIYLEDQQVKVVSRSGRDISEQFPELLDASRACYANNAVLDGEIVVLDEAGRPIFADVISRMHTVGKVACQKASARKPAVFYAVDCLFLDSRSIIGEPLWRRRAWLKTIIRKSGSYRFSQGEQDGAALFDAARQFGLEGIMAKNREGKYHPGGRTRDWLKVKFRTTAEALIIGYTEGQGDRSKYFGALHLAEQVEGELIYKGKVGTGFNSENMPEVLEKLEALKRVKKPIDDAVSEEKRSNWIEHKYYCEIQYASMTANGTFREPVFLRLRPDLKLIAEEHSGD